LKRRRKPKSKETYVFKSLSLAVLPFYLGLALPATAFEEAGISLQELSDGSIIEFESSFCEVAIGDTVSVMLMGNAGDAAEATVVAATVKPRNRATPNPGKARGGARTAYITAVIGMDGRVVEISNGDKLGINLHATACESDDAPI
jgi:hypothetical protein